MANRNFKRVQALNNEVKILAGHFTIAASGGAVTDQEGLGFSVANTGTGEYTVTLEDAYVALLAATASIEAAAAVDLSAQIQSHDVAQKELVLHILEENTPKEPAAVTTVHLVMHLRNSTVE